MSAAARPAPDSTATRLVVSPSAREGLHAAASTPALVIGIRRRILMLDKTHRCSRVCCGALRRI